MIAGIPLPLPKIFAVS